MYSSIVFVHVLGVFVFLLAHGAATVVTFRLRGEREVERVRALLELSSGSRMTANVSMFVTIIAGVAAGIMGNWWGHIWIWASLGLLILIAVAMNFLGTRSFARIRQLVQPSGSPSRAKKQTLPPPDKPVEQQLADALAAIHPMILTVVGVGGLALILWLMMLKPF
ncbi:MAG TPA: hypothetical protein VF040_22610 [Ktedonobacterales bacterium]